jgi:hypothetical protein
MGACRTLVYETTEARSAEEILIWVCVRFNREAVTGLSPGWSITEPWVTEC